VALYDAGLGRDRAGIDCLDYLDRLGMAAATLSHVSARMGDRRDMVERGWVSDVNRAALRLGCAVGDACRAVAEKLLVGAARIAVPPARVPDSLVGNTLSMRRRLEQDHKELTCLAVRSLVCFADLSQG
jgi:hypothetical protein